MRRKPRALPDPLEPRLQAPSPGERRTRLGGGSRNPVAHARLRGENRGGGSSPERRGGRTRWALPRSPSGSPPPRLAVHPPHGDRASVPCGKEGPRDRAAAHSGAGPHPGPRGGDQAGEPSSFGWSWRAVTAVPGSGGLGLLRRWTRSLATARATAPHSGQTALRLFARAPRLRWGWPRTL